MKFDFGGMLEQVQKMQSEMETVKEGLRQKTVTAESGAGMVTATVTGANQLIELKISKELINQEEIVMLEDLVVAAVNKALQQAQEMINQEMNKLTGMLPNIPGLNLNL